MWLLRIFFASLALLLAPLTASAQDFTTPCSCSLQFSTWVVPNKAALYPARYLLLDSFSGKPQGEIWDKQLAAQAISATEMYNVLGSFQNWYNLLGAGPVANSAFTLTDVQVNGIRTLKSQADKVLADVRGRMIAQ